MKISLEQKKGQELHQQLIAKAWKDSNFKNQLVNKPREVIEKFVGRSLKIQSNIVVEDQTNPGKIYLNIPKKLDICELELSDEQLEAISGGEETSIFYDAAYAAVVINYLIWKDIFK